MKAKKKILGFAAAIFALTLGMAFTACDGGESSSAALQSSVESSSESSSESSDSSTQTPPQKIELENFTNVSDSVALGEGYALPETVVDADGNSYDISYSVTTESGKTLGLIGNKVFVNYLETYYVVGTVEVADGDVRTQTITLTVVDEGKPWLTFGDIAMGQQGVEYTLPEITVSDDSGEEITPEVKLYLLDGDEKGEEVTLKDGKFTPDVGGYYYLEATAKDSTGNVGSAYEVLYMRANTAGTTQIVTFNDQAEVDANFQFTADADRKSFEKKYIPEFAGEKNVVQVRYTGSYWAPRFSIVPTQSVAADADIFEKYTHVVVRMYTVKSEECTNYWYDKMTMRNASHTSDIKSGTVIRQNEWVDYAFPISQLVDFSYWLIDENGNLGSSKTHASFMGHAESKVVTDTSSDAAHKGVYYVASVYVTNMAEVTTTGDKLGQAVTVSATVNSENKDMTNATLRIRKPSGAVLNVKGNSFTPTTRGTYEVTVLGEGFTGTTSISFTGVDAVNELISFNYDSDLSAVEVKGAGNISWVSEYEGKQGVLQYDVVKGSVYSPKLSFNFMQSYDDLIQAGYTDTDYVIVEMYVVSGDDKATTGETETFATLANNMYCAHGSGTKYATFAKGTTSRYVYNAWGEYVIPLKYFDGWSTSTHNLWGQLNQAGDTVRMYFADIRVEKSTLTLSVSGDLVQGKTVTVSATNASGAVDMTTNTILTAHCDSNGSRTADANKSTYTISQTGDVIFTVEKTDTGEFGVIIVQVAAAQ